MRDMEIDMTNPLTPTLWVKGKAIKRVGWGKVKAKDIITQAGFWGRKKQKAIDFYREYGVPASVCAKFLNDGLIRMSVGAVKGHEPLCYSRGKFNSVNTINVCEMKDELDQALADGNRHITPFIARMKMSPKELKVHFGEANWKAICKNSFSRNVGIAEAYVSEFRQGPRITKEFMPIEPLLKAPSTIFKYSSLTKNIEVATYVNKKCGVPIKELAKNKKTTTSLTVRIVMDTEAMSRAYDQKFSFEWSWRKMKEKHSEFSRIALVKEAEMLKQQDEKYGKTLREGKTKWWVLEGVKATFVDTFLGILEEGSNMHHCVGSYARSCYDNRYAVVHLEGDGEKSTLGITISPLDGHYSIQQHYGMVNAQVESKKHKVLAEAVVAQLNAENFDSKIYKLQHPEMV